MKKLFSLSFCVLLFSFVLVNCSGEPDKNNETEGQKSAAQATTSGARTINVIGVDKLKFVVREKSDGLQTGEELTIKGNTYYVLEGITAQAGEELTIKLEAISNLPATAMSHNWLLLKMGTDAKAFNDASINAKDNDYVAPDMMDKVITETGLVGNGETKSITFSAPDQTGAYDYLCTFPGHFTAGMKGTLTVK